MLPKLIVSLLTASCSPCKAYTHELTVSRGYTYTHIVYHMHINISLVVSTGSQSSHIYIQIPQTKSSPQYSIETWCNRTAPRTTAETRCRTSTFGHLSFPHMKGMSRHCTSLQIPAHPVTPGRAVSQQNNATFSHVEFGSSPSVKAEDSTPNTRYEPTNIQP